MEITKETAREYQLASAASRSRNAERRNAIKAALKTMAIGEFLNGNGLSIDVLTAQAKQEILKEVYPELLKAEFTETLKHNNRVNELLVKNELEEVLEDDVEVTLEDLYNDEFLKSVELDGLEEAYRCGRDFNESEFSALAGAWYEANS
ncbi:hypothetical protein [Vibrio campbellii]|uniref:hypothetical protein n=1 Tax=Vibrio campbellii TaxID=680 RepID=UPI003F829941